LYDKLIENKEMIIWLTGLSGSGKSTIGNLLKYELENEGNTVEWYDGDRVRKELKRESDFSKSGILNNSYELIDKIKHIKSRTDFIIVSVITPYREVREYARKIFGKEYFEVYVKCDKNTLIKRDTKGLYQKALNGEIDNLIGFSEKIPYEDPLKPDLLLETNLITPEYAVEKLINEIIITDKQKSSYTE
jgi:adenylyl-sulfate kinase